eukprot:scaffold141754_cov23-Tisochrysis_lutea.AAC.1
MNKAWSTQEDPDVSPGTARQCHLCVRTGSPIPQSCFRRFPHLFFLMLTLHLLWARQVVKWSYSSGNGTLEWDRWYPVPLYVAKKALVKRVEHLSEGALKSAKEAPRRL